MHAPLMPLSVLDARIIPLSNASSYDLVADAMTSVTFEMLVVFSFDLKIGLGKSGADPLIVRVVPEVIAVSTVAIITGKVEHH